MRAHLERKTMSLNSVLLFFRSLQLCFELHDPTHTHLPMNNSEIYAATLLANNKQTNKLKNREATKSEERLIKSKVTNED